MSHHESLGEARPPLRFRRLGIKPIRWAIYCTLDLGRVYMNLDFGWHSGWLRNFYVGGRYVQ